MREAIYRILRESKDINLETKKSLIDKSYHNVLSEIERGKNIYNKSLVTSLKEQRNILLNEKSYYICTEATK